MTDRLIEASMTIIRSTLPLFGVLRNLPDSLVVYRPSLEQSIASSLEILTGIFGECSGRSSDDPFFDFGPEPTNSSEALASAPGYLQECLAQLQKQRDDEMFKCPFCAMEVRGHTLMGLIMESLISECDD